ncbi:MAG TPA: toprim domain-containing protein, partial [Chitinophagaceae bacterium]|nr:toprim domain-containing protein [Chitinophagaceae bacterium]
EPGFYLSFAGSLSVEQHNLLKYALNRYPNARVITATDHDRQGERFADIIRSIRPDTVRAIPPIGKDWNDTLRTQAARKGVG